MSKRPPAAPPQLPGFEYLQLLGSGGFADVFLYEQQLPKRRVAVKVMLPDRLESAGQQFASEANVMAMLSTHPAIVTILQAGMSADQRPYIVMEHCPRPNLQLRYRRAPFSVAEAMRTAIPVIAAVETAHRIGVLHRDIKPANILVTEYNRPALTDFGIAAHAGTAEAAAGMSIPWSPPESFANPPRNGRATDIYQLGATLYTLLAARAPFEIPGQRNTSAELIDRAERMPLARIDRPDIPLSLQAALARAMAKNPDDRFPSAVAFARALQKVQIELEHSVTPIDILDDAPTEEFDDDSDGLTRVRNVTSISPGAPGARLSTTERVADPRDDHPTVSRAAAGDIDDATVVRPGQAPPGHDSDDTQLRPAKALGPVASPSDPGLGAAGVAEAFGAAGASAAIPADEAASSPKEQTLVPPLVVPPRPQAPEGAAVGTWDFTREPAAPGRHSPGAGTHVAGERPGDPGAHARGRKAEGTTRWPWVVGGGIVVAGIVAGAALWLPALQGGEPEAQKPTANPKDPVTETPPAVADLKGEQSADGVLFSWTNPDPEEGDTYQWGIDVPGRATSYSDTRATSVTVDAGASPTCIEVVLVRENGVASPESTACVE